jgi:hypothetical protein
MLSRVTIIMPFPTKFADVAGHGSEALARSIPTMLVPVDGNQGRGRGSVI